MTRGIPHPLVVALLLLTSCTHTPSPTLRPTAFTPDFTRSVLLEDVAETTANASIGDLDGDGDLDIVLAKGRHWPLDELILRNDGKGGFADRRPLGTAPDRSYTAALADLDGDGDLDLVVGNDRPDDKRIYRNDGRGGFTSAGTFGSSGWATRNVSLADLNGDRRPDIVVANRGGPQNLSQNQVCMNDGAGRFPLCVVLSGESATTIAAADFDGDGSIDLIVPHRDGGQSYLFPNDGKGLFNTRKAVGPANAATRAVAVGDLDGNGHIDLIMGDAASGGARLYLNQGQARFSESSIALGDGNDSVYAIATADLDLDGRLDVILGNDATPSVALMNRGDAGFESVRFGDGAGAVYGLAIGDVSGDGCPDIVAARSEARSVLHLNSCCAVACAPAEQTSQAATPAEHTRAKFGDPVQYETRDLPVSLKDLRTLERAAELLHSEAVWNRNDDRRCEDDEATGKRSLFCALQRASADSYGSHDQRRVADHRRVALQEVRFAVEDATRGRELSHRMMDFNNLPETTFADVHQVLQQATARVRARLEAN